jgi:uncharacterized protein with HEPN domain
MPSRDWKIRITDIVQALEEILELTRDMTGPQFFQDTRTVKAVLYNFAVIGEAARHVPPEVREAWPALPWREMGDMRNVVIHEYFGVDPEILWETIQQELPPLIPRLREMLAAGEGEP